MPQENIAQRARDLQALLGHSNSARPVSPAPSLHGKPFTLASPDEWATAWAESEVAVLTVAGEGFRRWTQQWMLGELPITGGVVMAPPGCVQGPPPLLLPMMLSSPLLPRRAEARQFCEKAAAIIDTWFGRIRDTLSVPSLLWFPTFVMHQGPIAPPTACIPARLGDMAKTSGGAMVPAVLAEELYRKATTPNWAKHFGDHKGDLGRIVCDRIAKNLNGYVQMVFQQATVQGVMGMGQVAGFAPPAVVVGPVMGRTLPSMGFVRGVDGVPSPVLTRA